MSTHSAIGAVAVLGNEFCRQRGRTPLSHGTSSILCGIYKQIAPMKAGEQAAYFGSLATQGNLGRWWKKVRRKQQPSKV